MIMSSYDLGLQRALIAQSARCSLANYRDALFAARKYRMMNYRHSLADCLDMAMRHRSEYVSLRNRLA